MRSIGSRVARGSLWIGGSRAATSILTFLSTIVLARILVPEDFGLVALGSTMIAIMSSVTNIPVASALIHNRHPTEAHYHSAWTISVIRGGFLAVCLAVAAPPLAYLYGEPRLDEVIMLLSLNLVVSGFTNPRLIMMQKKLIFWQVFAQQVANNLVTSVVSIAWVLVDKSYMAIVVGSVAGQLASTSLSYMLFPYRPRFSLRYLRELLSFSVWLTLGQIVATLNFRLDHLLLASVVGRAGLGHFTVGTNLAVTPLREGVQPLTKTLFPAFARVGDDMNRLRRGYQRAQASVTAVALPAGIGIALTADPMIRLSMGEKWVPAIPVMQVMAAGYAFTTLGSLVGAVALATGVPRLLFKRSLQIFALRVPCVIGGAYFGGLMGLVYASNFVGIFGILINMAMVRSLIQLRILEQFRANLRCGAAAALMTIVVLVLQNTALSGAGQLLSLGASVLAGATTYIATSWLLWLAAGRPLGPEAEALHLLAKLREWHRARRSRRYAVDSAESQN